MLQRGGGVLQGDTVNAQGNHLRVMCQRSDHIAQRGAVTQMLAVAQGEREPRPGARVSCQQIGQGLNFSKRRQGFAGQQVSPGIQQRFHPRAVKRGKHLGATRIVAPVLRSVGQIGTIRPDRARHQQRTRLRIFCQIRLARLTRQLDAFTNQRPGLRLVQPAGGKPVRRGLVAGGDRHLRPGAEVIEVDVADQLRVFH